MNKEFIPYSEALELKELGFDILSVSGFSYPDSDNLLTQAILFSQAFRWFRDNHGLFISIFHYENGYAINDLRRFETYEEAELACLKKLIEIVK